MLKKYYSFEVEFHQSISHASIIILMDGIYLGHVNTGAQSFHFVRYCSEKWNAEGLRSDGSASKRTVSFQKMKRLKSDKKVERYAIVPFPSEQANRKHANGTIAFPSEHKTKLVHMALFLCEQPICPFQTLEQGWNGTIAFPCELDFSCLLRMLVDLG